MKPSVFERNPVKTIIAVVLVIILALDVAAERLICQNSLFNKLLYAVNENFAYKVGIWQHRKKNPYYHHGLEPNQDFTETWGDYRYRLVTNSLGFKDATSRTIPYDTNKRRVLFIGDSFTEGVGIPYEKTFVGLVDKRVDHDKIDILNGAIVSYSPKLYFNKVKYLLDKNYKINDLYVFIDISDIFNELEYELFESQNSKNEIWSALLCKAGEFLRNNSFLFNVSRYYVGQIEETKMRDFFSYIELHRDEASSWTLNENIYKEWGERGVHLAEKHMLELVDLCKANNIAMTIAVYPWKNELLYGNRKSRNIQIWEEFARRNNINFINYYPVFFGASIPGINYSQVSSHDIVNRFFLQRDAHWNELGHELVADKIKIQ